MHTALNAPNTHSSNDSAHGPSSLLYSSIQPLNIKMFQPITPSEKSISEFYTQYKPGQTPSKDDIEVSSKVTPSHKATTNESYSIDKYYYPDNSEYLSKQSYVNSSVPSQPLTGKDSQKDITFNKELLDNMAVIEYEEFVLDGNLEFIRKRPTPKQKSVSEISFTPHQEQLINIKVVQQTPEENVNILSKEKKVESRRNDRREGSKVLSDTPSKDILDRKELTSTGKTGRSNRGSYDVDDSHLKRFIKGIKEHGEFSTENSDLSPDHINGYGLLFKEVEVLRNILREKETLLGADKEAKAISSELIKRNEELIIENTTLKCDMVKLTETLKQREGELMHLSDKNQHQRELMIKLEEKYALMERVNMNHEKDRKSQDEQISLLKEENKLLKDNTEKYKENIELLQGSYSQLKDNFESVTQALAHQKSEASNHNDTVNLYKLKVSRANDALKEQKEITASKEGIITNLLERLDEFARQIACKDAEIANLKGEIATMNEDVIHVKGDKVKLRTKSQADCNNVKQSFNMTDRTKLQLLIAQNKEHQSLTTRSILDFTRGHRGSQDSYSESVNYMTSVMEDERKTIDHPSTMTEGKRKKSGTHADEEQKLDRSSKNIKVTTSSGTKGKEKKVYHLHIGKEHRNYDGYETRRGGDVDVIDLALRSARGNSKGSAEKIKTLVVVQSPPAQIKPLNFTNTQRSLIEGSQTKRKCETYRPSAPTKPTEKERQTSKPVEGTKGHKRYPSQSSDDDKNGNKSARSTRNNSKRPSNVDNDYYDPYSIGVGTSKNSQLQTPLAVTSINFDSRREMLSAKSTRSQMFKVSEQTPKADKSPVQRKVKGVLIPGLEISKSLADAVIKNERAVKSARKK